MMENLLTLVLVFSFVLTGLIADRRTGETVFLLTASIATGAAMIPFGLAVWFGSVGIAMLVLILWVAPMVVAWIAQVSKAARMSYRGSYSTR